MILVIDSLQLAEIVKEVSLKQIHWLLAMLALNKLKRLKKNREIQMTCSQILKISEKMISD